MKYHEPGELGEARLNVTRELHEWLLEESNLYRQAQKLGAVGLMVHMQLTHLDEFLEKRKPKTNDQKKVELPVIGRCQDCRFWEPNKKNHYGECRVINGVSLADDRPPAGTLAYIEPGDYYPGSLETAPTFGCVLFQVKASD